MNTPGLTTYRGMELELLRIRTRHGGEESREEEIHLSRMDAAWAGLTDLERRVLNEERDLPQAIREMRPHDTQRPLIDTNIWLPRRAPMPVRRERALACI